MKRSPVEARGAGADGGGNAGERLAARRYEVEATGIRHDAIVRCLGQSLAHRLGVARVRQENVFFGAPKLDRYLHVFQAVR